MVFEPDVDELNCAVYECVAVVTQVDEVGVSASEVIEELRRGVGEMVREGELTLC